MTFFSWIPDGGPQKISPWLALYSGFTLLLSGTIFWFGKWSTTQMKEEDAIKGLQENLDRNAEAALFSRLSWQSSSSSIDSEEDTEKSAIE